MPGPHMEVNNGLGPLELSNLLVQYMCLSISGTQCVISVGLCVLQTQVLLHLVAQIEPGWVF